MGFFSLFRKRTRIYSIPEPEEKTPNQRRRRRPQLKAPPYVTGRSNLWADLAWGNLNYLRRSKLKPIVHCISDEASMDVVADIVSAAEACPAKMYTPEEFSQFRIHSHAFYFNLGVVTPHWRRALRWGAEIANTLGRKPWVMDLVAAGVSGFHLRTCIELLALRPHTVRGDGSRILALYKASLDQNYKDMNALLKSTDVIEAAKSLARSYRTIIVVSGAMDIVTDGQRVVEVKNGVHLLQKFAATEHAASALIAAFIAVNEWKPFEATTCALSVFGVASEIAIDSIDDPGSLQMHLIDALCSLDKADVLDSVNVIDISRKSVEMGCTNRDAYLLV